MESPALAALLWKPDCVFSLFPSGTNQMWAWKKVKKESVFSLCNREKRFNLCQLFKIKFVWQVEKLWKKNLELNLELLGFCCNKQTLMMLYNNLLLTVTELITGVYHNLKPRQRWNFLAVRLYPVFASFWNAAPCRPVSVQTVGRSAQKMNRKEEERGGERRKEGSVYLLHSPVVFCCWLLWWSSGAKTSGLRSLWLVSCAPKLLSTNTPSPLPLPAPLSSPPPTLNFFSFSTSYPNFSASFYPSFLTFSTSSCLSFSSSIISSVLLLPSLLHTLDVLLHLLLTHFLHDSHSSLTSSTTAGSAEFPSPLIADWTWWLLAPMFWFGLTVREENVYSGRSAEGGRKEGGSGEGGGKETARHVSVLD